MERSLHIFFYMLKALSRSLLWVIVVLSFSSYAYGQSTQVHNDAGIRLRVWLHGVWSDANCSETQYPSLFGLLDDNVKYVFQNVQLRASNGSAFLIDQMPQQSLINLFPINMTFRVRDDDVAKFWTPTSSEFRMLNPWYPFKAASMNITNQQVVAANVSRYAPPVLGATINPAVGGPNPVGLDASNGNDFLLFDRTFTAKAPDRFQWKVDGMWESDADIDESEAGLAVCQAAFGLPQVAERRKGDPSFPPLLTLLALNEYGSEFLTGFLLRQGSCTDLFGFIDIGGDPNSLFDIITNLLLNDYDDSYATKGNWSDNEAFFRGTPPGQVGYFMTDKIRATENIDGSDEGYALIFSYQWEWAGTTYPELDAGMRIQAPLCPSEQYTDAAAAGPIRVEAWIDGLFNDNDHEGRDLYLMEGLLGCSDISLGPERVTGNEEIKLRGRGWVSQQGEGAPAYGTTISYTQNKPSWNFFAPSASTKILDRSYTTQTGMRSFDFQIEAWESDCETATPTSCNVCILGFGSSCCAIPDPFGSGCWVSGYRPGVSDNDNRVDLSARINWRNSPPDKDNYYYLKMRTANSSHRSYIARIKYRWTIPKPIITSFPGPYDMYLCPGETYTMTAQAQNATFYQWQYVELNDPAGPVCPSIADDQWIDISGANCPQYTVPGSTTNTRIYRLKVFNRAGDGSKSPDGDKFAIAYSQCVRIQRLPQTIPMYSTLECGTSAAPTKVRSGSTYNFSPVLPPDSGSVDVAGIRYTWTATNGATVSNPAGPTTSVTFPSVAPRVVRVTMTSVFSDICPTAGDRSVSCFFETEDGGCDTVTGVIYAAPVSIATASGIGTIQNPFRIRQAFDYIRGNPKVKHLKLLEGTYAIAGDSAMIITNDLVVEGGYVIENHPTDGTIWVKRSGAVSEITSTINERINDSTVHRIGFRAINVNDWVIQDINLITTNPPNRDALAWGQGKGLSNYGVLVHNCNNFELINVNITTGNGGRGSTGITPSYLANGDCINTTNPAPSATGTNGANPNTQPGYGACDAFRLGGIGGNAGNPGGSSYEGLAYPSFGAGGTTTAGSRDGITGRNGTDDASGVATSVVFTDLASMGPYFVPKGAAPGIGGNATGGGGGGGSPTGGGGAGGIGGRGGRGGFGGGGAFGLWLSGPSGGTYRNIAVLSVGSAGPGGPGGLGEAGQPGGAGSNGGGTGGTGGQGGRGQQGGSGYALPIYQASSVTSFVQLPVGTNPVTPVLESNYNSGCTNSVFEIRKSSGTWSNPTLSGIRNVEDIAPLKGTTTTDAASPKLVYYPSGSLGAKSLDNGGLFYNQIYVRYDRTLPQINVVDRICSGTTIDLTSQPNSSFPIEYEWVIQEGTSSTINGVYTSPAPVFTFNTQDVMGVQFPPNNTASDKTYQVRYRVKDNCCGWSIPIYASVIVHPEIVNVIGSQDTTYFCNTGDPEIIGNRIGYVQTRPPNTTYQWYVSYNGGPFTAITPNGNAQTYDPPAYSGVNGTYRYVRVVGSTTATCADTSNVITHIIESNFTDNNISFPVPLMAECVNGALPSRTGTVLTSNANVGHISGSTPTGPGNPNNFWYKWEVGYRSGTVTIVADSIVPDDATTITISIDTSTTLPRTYTHTKQVITWRTNEMTPTESGTLGGNGAATSGTKDLNPGTSATGGYVYGSGASIFFDPKPVNGKIYFRRIVARNSSDFICRDTSNYVYSEVSAAAEVFGACTQAFASTTTYAACMAASGATNTTLLQNGVTYGMCLIQAPDSVCYGDAVNFTIPKPTISGVAAYGDYYAWYMVPGGPYINSQTGGLNHMCRTNNACSNPLVNTNCSNSKPAASATQLVGFYDFKPDTTFTMQVVLQETSTFYVQVVDKCFTDAGFRAASNPLSYPTTASNSGTRWQRKTVIVREPIVAPTSLTAIPPNYCTDAAPDSVILEVHGGVVGNAGYYAFYETDTNTANVIKVGILGDSTVVSRRLVIKPAPTQTTTYYARIHSKCDTTQTVSITVVVDTASTDPDALTGPDEICDGDPATLTVVGGSLGTDAEWVLYRNSISAPNFVASNTTGIFNVTPATTTTYIVRAETGVGGSSCLQTDTVMHRVTVRTDCVCDGNPGIIEYAETGKTTLATVECEGTDGWTYYADPLDSTTYLFAIEKKPAIPLGNTNDFTAEVYLTVTNNPTSPADVFYQEDLTACEANFVMPRYWNVRVLTGSISGMVRTRFFFPPAELAATNAAANTWLATNQPGCSLPLTKGPEQVFKNTDGTFFNPNAVAGHVPVASDVKATTINDYNYIGHLFSNLPEGNIGTQMGKNYAQVAWEGFSGGGVAVRVSPDIIVLPVTLLYFTGTLIDDKVHLNWETASELNNDYFVVEKSADARNWTALGSVKGNGTTNIPHKYALIDAQPYDGENYYRLRQVDFDGTASYSRVILINVNGSIARQNNFLGIHPNPTAGPLIATIGSVQDQHVTIKVLDITGRVMMSKEADLGKGTNNVQIDLTRVPAGSYILSFTDDEGQEHNVKVVKQ